MNEICFYDKKSDYYFLSHRYSINITINNVKYLSVDHYFQSQKFYQPENEKSMKYFNLIVNADHPLKITHLAIQKTIYERNPLKLYLYGF